MSSDSEIVSSASSASTTTAFTFDHEWKTVDPEFFAIKVDEEKRRVDFASGTSSISASPVDGLVKIPLGPRAFRTLLHPKYAYHGEDVIERKEVLNAHDVSNADIEELKSYIPPGLEKDLVVAGGRVLSTLTGCKFGDVDLFVVSDIDVWKLVEKLYNHYSVKYGHGMRMTRGHDVISFCVSRMSASSFSDKMEIDELTSCPLFIQLVLRRYASPNEVVTGFDVDCCGFCMYDGAIYGTPRALHALKTQTNYVDIDNVSRSYVNRLLKYIKRGFSVRIPGLTYTPDDFEPYVEVVKQLVSPIMSANGMNMYKAGHLARETVFDDCVNKLYALLRTTVLGLAVISQVPEIGHRITWESRYLTGGNETKAFSFDSRSVYDIINISKERLEDLVRRGYHWEKVLVLRTTTELNATLDSAGGKRYTGCFIPVKSQWSDWRDLSSMKKTVNDFNRFMKTVEAMTGMTKHMKVKNFWDTEGAQGVFDAKTRADPFPVDDVV